MLISAHIEEISLSKIDGIDDSIKDLLNSFNLGPSLKALSHEITSDALKVFLELAPIRVFKHKKKETYLCVAGWRQLMLAKEYYKNNEALVPVLIQEKKGKLAEIRKRFVVESIQLPTFFQIAREITTVPKSIEQSLARNAEQSSHGELPIEELEKLGLKTAEQRAIWANMARETLYRG
ncbi:hypothetical protein [Sneathiella aquimaris]|uniref:hypothetical protein n=1 Tax=Sneathiella aquimaris TaxID=2599305 RepID=UPI00146E6AC9|nr:hypothetical protein [Sneathiella aquimaris]